MAFRHRFRREQKIAHYRSIYVRPRVARSPVPRKVCNSIKSGRRERLTSPAAAGSAADSPARRARMIVPVTAATSTARLDCCADGQLVSFPDGNRVRPGRRCAQRRGRARGSSPPRSGPPITRSSCIIADASVLARAGRARFRAGARALADAFWPGPLTLILPRAARRRQMPSPAARTSVGPACARPSRRAGAAGAVRRRSAARASPRPRPIASGGISATTAQHVADDFGEEIAFDTRRRPPPARHRIDDRCLHRRRSQTCCDPARCRSLELSRVLGRPPPPAAPAHRAHQARSRRITPHGRRRGSSLPGASPLGARSCCAHPGAHIVVLAHSVAQPPDFEGTWFDAPAHDTAVRAASSMRACARSTRLPRMKSGSRRRRTARSGTRCAMAAPGPPSSVR